MIELPAPPQHAERVGRRPAAFLQPIEGVISFSGRDHVGPLLDLKVFRLRLQLHRQARRKGEARKKSGVGRGEIQNRRPISFGSQLTLGPVSREGSESLPSPPFIAIQKRVARGKCKKVEKVSSAKKRDRKQRISKPSPNQLGDSVFLRSHQ